MELFLIVCLNSLCISGAYVGQKSVSDTLKLELLTVVCCHMGVGNRIWKSQTLTLNSFTFCIEFIHTSHLLKLMSCNISH